MTNMFPVPEGGSIHRMLPWGERKGQHSICQIIEISDTNPDNNEFKTLCGDFTFSDFVEVFLAEEDDLINIDFCPTCSLVRDAERIINSI
tara:strand:+ start:290 stop:559 length:270 start_codon:yes stop_codon:yes gene_type:complete